MKSIRCQGAELFPRKSSIAGRGGGQILITFNYAQNSLVISNGLFKDTDYKWAARVHVLRRSGAHACD
jgi:hypothetical protein